MNFIFFFHSVQYVYLPFSCAINLCALDFARVCRNLAVLMSIEAVVNLSPPHRSAIWCLVDFTGVRHHFTNFAGTLPYCHESIVISMSCHNKKKIKLNIFKLKHNWITYRDQDLLFGWTCYKMRSRHSQRENWQTEGRFTWVDWY